MNHHTHRTIYSRSRGCLIAVAETAKSSGKASGLTSGGLWLQVNQGVSYSTGDLVNV
jgi:Extended Signal Peptide of Type V secretion system